MVRFDPDMTEIIFFDSEFYVPPEDRDRPGASLLANPCRPNHFFLGGVFHRYYPLKESSKKEYHHFWNWRDENKDEGSTLKQIFEFFQESWERLKDKDPRDADLILCGTGTSRFDVPVLFIRSLEYDFAAPDELFECYFKTKQVDLSNVGIAFVNKVEPVLYPRPTGQLLRRFGISEGKPTGMSVWEMYDNGDHEAIENRTEGEVRDCVKIYHSMKSMIFQKSSSRSR